MIMSQDAAIQAVTAAMQGDITALGGTMTQVASTLATAISEINSSPTNSVSDATLQALQAAQGQMDAAVQAAQDQATTEAGSVPARPARAVCLTRWSKTACWPLVHATCSPCGPAARSRMT